MEVRGCGCLGGRRTSQKGAIAPAATLDAPALVRRHDPVRDADLLLLPGRVGVLKGSAAAVVGLCDGNRSVRDIVHELAERFPGAPVAAEVPLFLERLREEGWLR